MIRRVRCAGLAVLALCATACAQKFDAVELGVPVALAGAAATPVTGDSFSITRHPVWFFYGLLPSGQPNLQDVLAGQVGTGKQIANLRIYQRMRWSDVLLTVLTVGLASPRSITFEGVVVSTK